MSLLGILLGAAGAIAVAAVGIWASSGKDDPPKKTTPRNPREAIDLEKELEAKRADIDEKISGFQKLIIEKTITDLKNRLKKIDKKLELNDTSDASIPFEDRFNMERFESDCNQLILDIESGITKFLDSEITKDSCKHILEMSNGVKKKKAWNDFRDNVIRKALEKAFSDIEDFNKKTMDSIREICNKRIATKRNIISKQKKDLANFCDESKNKEDLITDIMCTIANAMILKDLTNVSLDKCYFTDFTQE